MDDTDERSVTFITDMDTPKPSHLLLGELLVRLGLDRPDYAKISSFARPTVDRMLDGDTQWNSRAAVKKAAASFGMTDGEGGEFDRFLRGEMPMDQAVKLATPTIRRNQALLKQREELAKRVKGLALKYERDTGEPLWSGLRDFVSQCVWDTIGHGASDADIRRAIADAQITMTEHRKKLPAKALPQQVRTPETASASARKSGSDRPTRRR